MVPVKGKGEIAIFRFEGTLYAVDNTCPHEGGSLCDGLLQDGVICCPLHGWVFELKTGECHTSPGQDIQKFSVWEEKGSIFLDM